MRYLILIFVFLTSGLLSACSSNPNKLQISQIDSFEDSGRKDGYFKGLEQLANQKPGSEITRLNIFYLHGMGWTEDPENDPLAGRLLNGMAEAYDVESEEYTLQSQCGVLESSDDQSDTTSFITITTGELPITYKTFLPGVELRLQDLICMDRQTLRVNSGLEFIVYRVFWDEIFWEQLQEAHIGQDDNQGFSKSNILDRKKYNRRLKDEMVNFGFSDAVMYLGPAGREIRLAVKGAMCSALLDASGITLESQGGEISAAKACLQADNREINANQFAFMSESLGSKITFDVMRDIMTDNRFDMLDDMIAGTEVYMLANQLALLSLSDLSREDFKPASLPPESERPRIIALSEFNDILTYEINSFMENLWDLQFQNDDQPAPTLNYRERESISAFLGFDFVDVRLQFADPIIALFGGFVDPLQAHTEHLAEPGVIRLILCGAENGTQRVDNCKALKIEKD